MSRAHRLLLAWLALGIGAACTEIPDEAAGERILGTITYQGTAHLGLRRPAIRVMLDLEFPPTSDPLAFQIIEAGEQPDFPARTAYELKGIDPFRYKLVAQLVDLAAPEIPAMALPLGGYPDACALLSPQEGWVVVTRDQPVRRADFQLYDYAGTEDPCNAVPTVCPRPGLASLNLTIRSRTPATSSDRLLYALFSSFPALTPTRSKVIPGAGIAFPHSLFDNAVAPGGYAALYVCLDVGGNSGTGLCTDEDAFVLATPTTPLAFSADTILNVIVDLDDRTLTVTGPSAPSALGCEALP